MKAITSNYTRWKLGLSLFLIIFAAQLLVVLPKASAVSLSTTMVRLNRLAKSTATAGTVCAKANVTADAEGKVLLTFPAGFTVGASWTTDTATTTGWPSGALAWPTIQATGTGSGQVATFTSGNIPDNTNVYCFNWTNTSALTTPSTTGSYTVTVDTQTSGGSALETGGATTNIVDTNCGTNTSTPCDQINVTASVNQSFTFTLQANDVGLGALSTSSPTHATALNATVSTNAQAGWQMWAADANGTGASAALHSTIANKKINYSPAAGVNAAALSNGVEGYNLGVGTPAGTTCTGASADAKFTNGGSNTSNIGGGLDGTLRTLATATGVANACAVPLVFNASISSTTPAATDYASTVYVVAAGLF